MLLAIFDEEVIDNFVESLRTDRLARFIQNVPEFENTRSWDKIRVEIDFNSTLTAFEFIN